MSEKVNLTWHSFRSNFSEWLRNLWTSEKYSDVTIVCDDQFHFKVHRFILTACSSIFQKIIENRNSENVIIYLRGVKHEEMRSILQFLYLGETSVSRGSLTQFLNVAEDLHIKEVHENMSFVNICQQEIKAKEPLNPVDESDDSFSNVDTFNCNFCNTEFQYKSDLQVHIKSMHELRKYPCSVCDHVSTASNNLLRHVRAKHGVETDKKYLCQQCDYKSIRSDYLKTHMKSHLKI